MEERIPLLRGKVGSEAKGVDKKVSDLSQEWEAGRPLSKEHTPSEVRYCKDGHQDDGKCRRCFLVYLPAPDVGCSDPLNAKDRPLQGRTPVLGMNYLELE